MAKKLKAFRMEESLISDLQELSKKYHRNFSNQVTYILEKSVDFLKDKPVFYGYEDFFIKKEEVKKEDPVKWVTFDELYDKLDIRISKKRFLNTLLNSSLDYKRINQIYYFKDEKEFYN